MVATRLIPLPVLWPSKSLSTERCTDVSDHVLMAGVHGTKEGSIVLRVTTETSLCSEEEKKKQSIAGIPQELQVLLDETDKVVGAIFIINEE